MKSRIFVLISLLVVLCTGCQSLKSQSATKPPLSLLAAIRVSKLPPSPGMTSDAYLVKVTAVECKSSEINSIPWLKLMTSGFLLPPEQGAMLFSHHIITVNNQWSEVRAEDNFNRAERFEAEVVLGNEVIKTSHVWGSVLRIKTTPSKQPGMVHATGILSIATKNKNAPRFRHSVIPINLDCKLEEEKIFYKKSRIATEK